jgi:hypothetical protein
MSDTQRLFLLVVVATFLAAPTVHAQENWGTLDGRVTFHGKLPAIADWSERIKSHQDKVAFKKASPEDMLDPTWRIDGKTRGVANVCVYLKRPANGVLPIHSDDKVRKNVVTMDAPHCCFVPHTVAICPEWYDGSERGKTGQTFIIKNTSQTNHAFRFTALSPVFRGSANYPAKSEQTIDLRPQRLPIYVSCSFHAWMNGHVWVFDHPYFALTKADGAFTIPRVPAGMEIHVMAWHEAHGWLFTKNGKAMTLKAGKNTFDFQISAEPPK